MEHTVQMQDDLERIMEASRIQERIHKYKQADEMFCSFGIPQKEFKKALSAFEQLTNLLEIGLDVGQLEMDKETDIATNSDVLRFLRFLTEIEICTHEDYYKGFVTLSGEYASVLEFCQVEVRPENAEANNAQIVALVNALGVPLLVENLDTSLTHGLVLLNQHLFYPRPESEEGAMLGPLNLHDTVSSESRGTPMDLQNLPTTSGSSVTSSSTEALGLQSVGTSSTPSGGGADERTIDDLSWEERRRLVTLLYRPGHYDILYPV
uniref:ubiquitinyl hydrolase 1 n=2 Tax=Oryza brachyantha TaxID=4533 RepID=J3M245_ORYBR